MSLPAWKPLWPSPEVWANARKRDAELKQLIRDYNDFRAGRTQNPLDLMAAIRQRWPDRALQRETIRKLVQRLRDIRSTK